jgi:hypothetical protein
MAACIRLKASSFGSWWKNSLLLKMHQLILGTGTAIWWLKEPHWSVICENISYYETGEETWAFLCFIYFLILHNWSTTLLFWFAKAYRVSKIWSLTKNSELHSFLSLKIYVAGAYISRLFSLKYRNCIYVCQGYPRGQCYKIVYNRNLLILVISKCLSMTCLSILNLKKHSNILGTL